MIAPTSVAVWMPLFLKDHRARASTLNHIEHSVLVYLRMHLWEQGGTVADDDKALARECRLSLRQWQALRPVLLRDCVVAGGRITAPDIIGEVAKARINVEQKKKAGKASAAARAVQRESNGCSTAVATAVQPRAGGGVGEGSTSQGHIQTEEIGGGRTHTREARPGLTVIGGGK